MVCNGVGEKDDVARLRRETYGSMVGQSSSAIPESTLQLTLEGSASAAPSVAGGTGTMSSAPLVGTLSHPRLMGSPLRPPGEAACVWTWPM